MKKLWNWIFSLFTSEKIGIIWRTLFTAAKNTVAEMVSDPANQQKAWDIAKSLMSSRKTNGERLAEFNAQMKAWAKAAGKQLTDAAINALRENAVVALKGECADGTCCEGCSDRS